MQKIANIVFNDNQFSVSGELGFSNVMSLYEQSLPQLERCAELNFDFSQVKSSDSSGLALIIEWMRFAKQHQRPIHFTHVSNEIMSIAKAAGLDKFM